MEVDNNIVMFFDKPLLIGGKFKFIDFNSVMSTYFNPFLGVVIIQINIIQKRSGRLD